MNALQRLFYVPPPRYTLLAINAKRLALVVDPAHSPKHLATLGQNNNLIKMASKNFPAPIAELRR